MSHHNTSAVPFAVTVLTTDSPLLPPNSDRYAVTFSPPGTNRYTISFDSLAVIDQGITMSPLTQPLTLCLDEQGNAIQQPIRAISALASQVVSGIEWIKVK